MQAIYNETKAYNILKFSVLIIFPDIKHIERFEKYLYEKLNEDQEWHPDTSKIYKITGNENEEKPEIVSGQYSAITLSSNFCGRGTDIKPRNMLHVILAYYSNNERIVKQAIGRLGRGERNGT